MKGWVSIIVACYNGEKYIERCFNCILNQSYKKIEVVFGDDGSNDNSFDYASSFKAKFEEQGMVLKCFSQQNIGMVTNKALSLCTGEFVAVYDVDDIIYPSSIEKRVNLFVQEQDYSCVRTNGYKMDSQGNKSLFSTNHKEKNNTDIFEDLLLGRTYNWAGSYMVRREALVGAYNGRPVFETRYGANLQILLVAAYGNKSGYIDEPLMEYQYNVGSITRSDNSYELERRRYVGFKKIRESILDLLDIRDMYQRSVDIVYQNIFLDLDLNYQKSDLFVEDYEYLRNIKYRTPIVYTYYYHKFKCNRIRQCYFRILVALSSIAKRMSTLCLSRG